MGYFETSQATTRGARGGQRRLPTQLLERQGCLLCTLNDADLLSPKIKPTGAAEPVVLILGEAPGRDEDKRGEPFVGRAGRLLRGYIPVKWEKKIRYSNTIRCWPGEGNPDPSEVQTACCRMHGIKDIEATKPLAIFGMGGKALAWAIGDGRINLWRGRHLPVKVGTHTCWFFPINHPSFVLHSSKDDHGKSEEVFGFDMKRAFREVSSLPDPVVHTPQIAKDKLILFNGDEPGALRAVKEYLQAAMHAKRVGVDYETNAKRPYGEGAIILSAGVSFGEKALSFAMDHKQAAWSDSDKKELIKLWLEFLSHPVVKVSHGLSFELEWTGVKFGTEYVRASRWEDDMTQAAVIDSRTGGAKNKDGPLSLGWLTMQHFGLNIKKLSNAAVNKKKMGDEPLDKITPYNAVDARYHLKLFEAQAPIIKRLGLVDTYEDMVRRVPTVVLTQIKGIPTNVNVTYELEKKYAGEIAPLEDEIFNHPEVKKFERRQKKEFVLGAPAQVKNLFIGMGYHVENADAEGLEGVDHPLKDTIIKWRKVTKKKATYVDSWMPGKGLWPDGLLHQNLNTLFAETGRSSADEPNTQNVIKRDVTGKEVRRQVQAPKNYVIFSSDSGQIQPRNIAMESRDPVFCKMLWEDYDVHSEWGERICRAYPDLIGGMDNYKSVAKEIRQKSKNKWVLPLFFGSSQRSVENGVGVPEGALSREYKLFWRTFEGVHAWQERLLKGYRENGYVESIGGYRRQGPLSYNQIINSPIQADEAQIVFSAFNRLSEMPDPYLQANIEVHDDLVFFLPANKVDYYADIIVTEMLRCDYDWINVPLQVEISVGKDWEHMDELPDKFRSDRWLGTPIRAPEYV